MWIDDDILRLCHLPQHVRIFVPKSPVVVMARSNPARDCDQEFCQKNSIPILRRLGGGGAVLLDPGCVIISAGLWVSKDFNHPLYFEKFHRALLHILAEHFQIHGELKGLADIAIKDRKCVGASLFRSQKFLLYQGSLMVSCDISLMHHCLKHPSKEPDYRQGRDHRDFVINLKDLKGELTAQSVCTTLENFYPQALKENLGSYLIEPQPAHIPHLKKRMGSP